MRVRFNTLVGKGGGLRVGDGETERSLGSWSTCLPEKPDIFERFHHQKSPYASLICMG